MAFPWKDGWRHGQRGGGWRWLVGVGYGMGIAGLLALGEGVVGASELEGVGMEATEERSPWIWTITLQTWAGYNDNPQLSAVRPEGSALVAGSGEMLWLWLGPEYWEAEFFTWLEHIGYVSGEATSETVGLATARVSRRPEQGWGGGVGMEMLYARQALDASELQGIPVIVQAEGISMTVRPAVTHRWGSGWEVAGETEVSRQEYLEPLDDFWDIAPRVGLTWDRSEREEWLILYRQRLRDFDTRTERGPGGETEGGALSMTQMELEAQWRRRWGDDGSWRTLVRAGYARNRDHGGGFYDYHRWQVGATVRRATDHWEWLVEGRIRDFRYPLQEVEVLGGDQRRRLELSAGARGAWKFRPGYQLFVQYAWEESDENQAAADYSVNTVSLGVQLEM